MKAKAVLFICLGGGLLLIIFGSFLLFLQETDPLTSFLYGGISLGIGVVLMVVSLLAKRWIK